MRSHALIAGLTLLVAASAEAAPLFSSPPHFLTLGDRQRIVFFLNEPVSGALAARPGDERIEVMVPNGLVDPAIAGTTFAGDDPGPTQARIAGVVLRPSVGGGATIRIDTARRVAGVDARPEDDPPRLVIELLARAPKGAPTPRAAAQAAAHAPDRKAAATVLRIDAEAADAEATDAEATDAEATDAEATTHGHAPTVASILAHAAAEGAAPTTAPTPAHVAAAATADATATAHAIATERPRPTTTAGRPAAQRSPAPRSPEALAAIDRQIQMGSGSGTRGGALPSSARGGVGHDDRMPCHLMRTSGVPFCAPNPDIPPYAANAVASRLANALAQGSSTAALPGAFDDGTPAALYLAADRELVTVAPSRRLLPAIDAYRRALRRYPGFVDAPRARLNVAFAFRVVGFREQLASAVAACAGDPGAPLAFAAAGDLAAESEDVAAARRYYDQAEQAGGVGACLATRGRAGLAALAGDPTAALADTARLSSLCPRAITQDPDTERVVARAKIAAGDAAGALAILTRVGRALGPRGGTLVMEDSAAAAAAAGDDATARHLYEQLAAGSAGAQAARRATIALARMDAARGDVGGSLARLDGIETSDAGAARATIAGKAVGRALDAGAGAEAIALLHDHGVEPASLPVADQIRLAAIHRTLGLPREGERIIERLHQTLGSGAPDALWSERGESALAAGDAPGALAVADEWLRVRGRANAGPVHALRARALATIGDVAAVRGALAAAIGASDPVAAAPLRIDVATRLTARHPAAAREILDEALRPGKGTLEPSQTATALRALADAAERAHDDRAAVAALTRLSEEHAGDPSAAGAAYRLARLRAGIEGGAGARDAYQGAAKSGDALERRIAAAAEAYEQIVSPFERPLPAGLAADPQPPVGGAEHADRPAPSTEAPQHAPGVATIPVSAAAQRGRR